MNRLICGDSLVELKRLLDRSVDLLCTDPPYGDNCGYGRAARTISSNEHPLVGLLALSESWRILKNDTTAYFFLDVKHLSMIDLFVRRYTDFAVRDYVVWDKNHIGMGRGFRKRYELIGVFEKGRPRYASASVANVIRQTRVRTVEHPHKKPLALIQALISHSTRPGALVLDPFLGSGTTAVAASLLGREYIGIESERKYVDICRARVLAGG